MTRYQITHSLPEYSFHRNLYSQYFGSYSSDNITQISNNLISTVPVKTNSQLGSQLTNAILNFVPLQILIPAVIVIGTCCSIFGNDNS